MSIYPPTGTLEIKNATLRIPVVDLQYTSNTAKLEANSNVVTEFSRSKKLIKYPRVLLTSAALNSAYENGYRVTFSSENTSYRAYHPFSRDENSAVGWHSSNGTTGAPYDGTGGLYGTSGTARLAAETERGEWLGLELPVAIKLERLRMVSQNYSPAVNTIDDFIVYAKKQSGDTWTNIGTFTGIAPLQTSADGAMFDVNAVEYYKFFAIVATKRDAAGAGSGVSIRVLEYFGVPEYDPDADGTDVTLKSLANVPNTDWLEIYYDAKDLEDGAVTSVSALGGTTNGGTAVGDTQVSNGAFVFDGSGDYIYNSQSGYTSRVVYTGCAWIKKASATNGCIFQFGTGSNNSGIGLFSFGSPSETKTMRAFVYGGADADYKEDVPLNEWFHVVAVISDKKATLYLNGVVAATDTGSTTITIPSTPYLSLGVQTNSSNTPLSSTYFDGSIANFRLFNRNLTADEVYQLYAYQKEYFGHSTNNLTLKAGRLGIGTSEPRAALDVRGRITREYNPGEIIEELITVCNGRPVTVLSGTYTPTNVTAAQTSSATYTEINGSNITYNKPVGAKRIYYKFACNWEDAGNGALTNFKIQVYHNGAWRDINPSRYLHSATYTNDGNNHGSAWVINEYIFECDANTESQHDGYFLSSKTSYLFRVVWRHHGSSYASRLHESDWWDGTGTNILHPPQLTIRAIA